MKAAIKSLESAESREKYRRLRRAEKLFLQAAEQAGNNELVRFIQSDDEEEEKAYLNAFENEEIISLVEKVANGNFDPKEKVYLGEISNELVDTIKELTDIDTTGFKIAVEARQINHILKDHGKNGKSDKSMSDYSDIAKIEYALNEYDDISRGKSTNAYKNVINGKTQGAQTILYEKNIGDRSYYVVQAVPDTKSKTLFVVSAFIGEKGYKKEAPQFANDNNLGATSEIGTANTSNDIISQKSKKSTPEVKKSKKIQPLYAGDKSKTANHSLLAQAEKLEAQGVDSEEIRRKTGWFKGYDGKWRYEIDDSAMEILDFEVNEKTTLGKLIKHDKLFEAYPELKDLKVYVGEGNYGFYSIDYNYISLGYNGSGDYSKFKYNLLHEIQHAIQIIEGFATGSSKEYWQQVFEEKNREEYERLEFEENRVLDYNKNEGHTLTVIAQHTRLGNITEASLNNSISQFLKKINTFKQKKKIQYSRKADGEKAEGKVDLPLLNRSQFKIYTKDNAEQIISGIAFNTLNFNDGTQGVMKNKGELVDLMWRRLNSTDEGKRGGIIVY